MLYLQRYPTTTNIRKVARPQSATSPQGNFTATTIDAQRTYAVYRTAAETQALEARDE